MSNSHPGLLEVRRNQSAVKKKGHDHSVTSAATFVSATGISLPGTATPASSANPSIPPSGQVVLSGSASSEAAAFDQTIVSHDGISIPGVGSTGLPDRVGHYRITRLIGAGGMGAVYEAEQDNPRRTVALKVMRGAIASPQASRRFEYESQLLARLRHPSIAQVYEAGTHSEPITGAAMPYFAMEFIPDAKTLTEYATACGLTLTARLELFIAICDAVQHGHQRGVIHRDLKPANILIDTSGHPKIIDFGVARANEEGKDEPGANEHSTKAGQLVGTLQYMSPEQCGQDSADIDVRADVYALGVILFELLTGALPHALDGTALFAAVMIIREDPPVVPSSLRRELKGDLDTIILKALEKDRARRYGSAADLAADIGRFLRSEPIVARQIGVAGRLTRWVKRNRAVATVIAASTLILVSTSVVLIARILRESARANAALIEAERNLRAAKDNFSLIKTFFGSMRPNSQKQGLVDVELLLDNASRQVVEKPPQMEATEADFREIIAAGYQGLGRYAKSVEHQSRVIELRQRLGGKEDLGLADSLHQYAAALWWSGKYEEAVVHYQHSLAIRQKLLGNEHVDIAMSFTHLAACKLKLDQVQEAATYYKQALDMRRKLLGNSHEDVAASINNLAKVEVLLGQTDRAEAHFREALAMIQAIKPAGDLTIATAQNNLALFLIDNGKPQQAIDLVNAALETRLAKLNANHHFVNLSRLALARAQFAAAGDVVNRAAAARTAADVLASLEKILGADHPDVIDATGHVGLMLAQSGAAGEGLTMLQRIDAAMAQNKSAPRRDRNESSLRMALASVLGGNNAQADQALLELMQSIQPGQISTSLRAACVAVASTIEPRDQFSATLEIWSAGLPQNR
jgi:serine/threonine protein kinase/Tfp pilus assembly protein PilF